MISKASLIAYCLFFGSFTLGVGNHVMFGDEVPELMEIFTGVAAFLALLSCLLELSFYEGDNGGKYKVILFALGATLFTSHLYAADLFEVERARVAAADAIAFTEPDTSAPIPTPSPSPSGETCQRCQGAGRIKPDGRIEINCPECGGDGKRSVSDIRKSSVWALEVPALETKDTIVQKLMKHMEECQICSSDDLAPLCPEGFRLLQAVMKTKKQESPVEANSIPPALARQPATRPFVWDTTSLIEAERIARFAKDVPIIVYWTADWCAPCLEFEKDLKSRGDLQALFSNATTCKINIDEQSNEVKEEWGVTSGVPVLFVVTANWEHKTKTTKVLDAKFGNWLSEALVWASSQITRKSVPKRFSRNTCNCSETGICLCGDDCQCVDCPEHTPSNDRLSRMVRNAALTSDDRIVGIRNVQWSGGSVGGQPTYYQSQPQMAYGGSAGGQPAMAYGSAGGNGGGNGGAMYYPQQPMQYSAPVQYYAPQTYSQPTYSGWGGGRGYYQQPTYSDRWGGGGWGNGGGGRTIVCGPNGCFVQ